MNKALLVCALGAAFIGAQAARADSFNFSFSGTSLAGNSFSDNGNVTFTASTAGTSHTGHHSYDPYTAYQVTGIAGNLTIGSDTYTIDGLDAPPNLGGDNYVDLHSGSYTFNPDSIDFDVTKISGTDPETFSQILLTYDASAGAYSYTLFCVPWLGCVDGSAADIGTAHETIAVASVAATPEPDSLALLGTSILGGAGLLRRRFRA